ncbi:hypothetical protein NUSPORA_01945 [Nucleospora cyclopteri]
MAKRKNQKINQLNNNGINETEDSLSETNNEYFTDSQLETEMEAYYLLEHLDVEFPSQSIQVHGSFLYFSNQNTFLIHKLPLKDDNKMLNFDSTKIETLKIPKNDFIKEFYVNRIRSNSTTLFLLGENFIIAVDLLLFTVKKVVKTTMNGFGLLVTEKNIFIGKKTGEVEIYSLELILLETLKIHEKSVESIANMGENVLITAGCDFTLKFTALGEKKVIYTVKNDCDINSVAVSGNNVIYGDDKGRIGAIKIGEENGGEIEDSLRNDAIFQKIISDGDHKSSIEMVKFLEIKDELILCACSEEQLAIYDLNLVEESEESEEINKYLLFVHQGQKFYKDVDNVENMIITTSADGITFFIPISLIE